MRYALADELTAMAGEDERIVLLSGDIGNNMWNDFKLTCPDRFVNCGVAEANMMSVAAGMAQSGLRPVAYTITTFNTTRCYEQIKVDVGYHDAPVVIVGTGSGLCYAKLGATHHALEDISILRQIPTMTVLCPGDPLEVKAAIHAAVDADGPVYFRLGRKGEPTFHDERPDLEIGDTFVIEEGSDVCILSTGNTLDLAVETAQRLDDAGISAQAVSFPTVKPLNEPFLVRTFADFDLVATVEEHSVVGGLGGAIAEWLADRGPDEGTLLRFGTPDAYVHEIGSQEHVRREVGLEPDTIARRIQKAYN